MKTLNPGRRVVLFVPTGPLVTQQAGYIRRESNLTVLELSGQHAASAASAAHSLKEDVDALVVTPQYFINMLFNNHTAITNYSAMIFDEAHHATGKHPYREILQKLAAIEMSIRPRVVGLTASPFGESSRDDTSQAAFMKLTESFSAELDAPTIFVNELAENSIPKEAKWVLIEETIHETMLRNALRKYIDSFFSEISKLSGGQVVLFGLKYDRDDAALSQFLAKLRVSQGVTRQARVLPVRQVGERDHNDQQGVQEESDLEIVLAHIRKIASSFYDLNMNGPSSVAKSLSILFEKMAASESASRREQRTFALVEAKYKETLLPELKAFPHEKFIDADISTRVQLVAQTIRDSDFTEDSRAIVFVRRRRTAIALARAMEDIEELKDLNPTRFVGHNSYEGMSWQEEQKPTLDKFRQGRIRLLVATNVLEEGLDVPECSLVIQFDGIIGVTSLIQSRGRARQRHSNFVIFCPKGGQERCEQLVERERRLILTARRMAEMLPSKEIVERLINETSVLNEPEAELQNFVGARHHLSSSRLAMIDSAVSYSVVFGGFPVRRGKDATEDDFVQCLKKMNELASVVILDKVVGLCSFEAARDKDIFESYNSLCESTDFAKSSSPFWMRFESIDKHDGFSDPTEQSIITDVTLHRGMFTPHGEFVELPSHMPTSGVLELGARSVCIDFRTTRQRIEFDLRGLSDFTVRFSWAQKSDVDIHLSCALPPLFFSNEERECFNYQFRSLQYIIRVPKLPLNLKSLWHLRKHFSKYGVEVRDTWILKTKSLTADPTQAPYERLLEPPVAYGLQCFLSSHSYFLDGALPPEFFGILNGLSPNIQADALLGFRPSPDQGGIVDQFEHFVEREEPMMKAVAASAHLNKQTTVYKAIVTPTRIVFCPPETAPSNRVFRKWGANNFMYVYFRDENMERLDYTDHNLLERIRSVMLNGITINNAKGDAQGRTRGLKFRFLGCSLSQVRNSSAVFTLLDPHAIREWVGDFSQIQTPAKYLKRLGQAFSATRESYEIDQSVLDHPVEDIANETYTFTDGCGQISKKGAEEIVSILHLSYIPSAFQIRVGGAKGVVVVSDDVANDDSDSLERSVVLRKSMSKFLSTHRMLEIVACSVRSDAYLTRQSIQILSDLGIEESVFMEMQESYLDELRSLLASDDAAYFQLKGALPPTTMWWVEILVRELGVKILLDEFLSSMIRTVYNYRMTNTLLRARIPVAKGRTMMGVADFTGTLSYGEVFVQYSELDDTSGIERHFELSDVDVVVHRSPCHHPGDVRVLRCRSDVPAELKMLRDCIVFPCKGPRPHPDECTGGDLDGDVFVVIWDERLIPSRANIQDPMEFDADAPSDGDLYESTSDECIIDFYINSIREDILGVASNAHLALCDKSESGSFDEDAKQLARICSKQVDSLRAQADLEIVRRLAPKEYPDFMQSRDKPSYPSTGVLGKLYRRCTTLMGTSASENARRQLKSDFFLHMDEEYLVNGYELYRPGAEVLYRQYKLRLAALLNMSGASTEAEVLTGMIVEPPSIYKANYFRFGEQCKDAFFKLQGEYHAQFLDNYGSLGSEEHQKVAAAWYYVAYNDSDATSDTLDGGFGNTSGSRGRFLSFPFILIKFLIQNKRSNAHDPDKRIWKPVRRSNFAVTTPRLQLSLLAEVMNNTEDLLSGLFDRLVAVSSLQSALPPHFGKKHLDLTLFGSSALLTFEAESDLDVMVQYRGRNGKRGTLAMIAEHFIKAANESGERHDVDLKDDIHVPLLTFSFDKWSVDMVHLSNGPLKTKLFRTYVAKYAFFWPCVFFLVRWGKCVGLVRRRSGGGDNLFVGIGMMWFFLGFCIDHRFVEPIHLGEITLKQIIADYSIETEIKFWTSLLTGIPSGNASDQSSNIAVVAADVLLKFMSYFGKLSTPKMAYAFSDPYDVENNTQLDDEGIDRLRSECYRAFHQLVVTNGDVHALLTHRKDQRSVVTLSRALSRRLHEARDFFARKILMDAKADSSAKLEIQYHPNALRSDLYVAVITGDGRAVQRVEERIRQFEQELGMPVMRTSKSDSHREGSGQLLFEGAQSQHESIGFQDYFGRHHVDHNNMRLHQAHLICFMNGMSWYEPASLAFSAKFVEQMVKLSRYEHLNPSTSTAKAFIRFGHHYLIHLPRSFDEETIVFATIKKLEDEFERGRTARELFEAVMVAKRKDREDEGKRDEVDKVGATEEDGGWGNAPDDEYGEAGDGGWSDMGPEVDGRYDDYDESHFGDKSNDEGSRKAPPMRRRRRRVAPELDLRKAATIERADKGVTHSFFTMIDPVNEQWTRIYALELLGMEHVRSSENYQTSIIHDGLDFNVRLADDLQLLKITTRPSRWFNSTVKMHQELDEETGTMDTTPDMRFYVTLAEEVPESHELMKKLSKCCEVAPDGQGIVEFTDPDTRDNLRITKYMERAGFFPSSIPTIRHIRSETFRCAGDGGTGLQFTVMQVREFGVPDRNSSGGYMSIREHSEVEFVMPPLTPERRLNPEFAREFLATGLQFVEFLRARQATFTRGEL